MGKKINKMTRAELWTAFAKAESQCPGSKYIHAIMDRLASGRLPSNKELAKD